MNPHYSFDIDAADIILGEIFRLKPGFNQIDATNKPLVCCFSFLQSDVSTRLKLSLQLPDTWLVSVSEFFVYGVEYLLDVVDLLLFQMVNLLQFSNFVTFLTNIVHFQEQVGQVFV